MMKKAQNRPDRYYRRDQKKGISPPDLSKEYSYAEHIVHARGKRSQYTSVSLDPTKIWDLGDATYRLKTGKLKNDGHSLIEHDALIEELRHMVKNKDKADRIRALQAVRYATRRREGLVDWNFDISDIDRKDLITWAMSKVRDYFSRKK